MKSTLALLPLLFLAACATKPIPVLAPNRKLERVGEARAEKDIQMCVQKMEKKNATGRDERRRRAMKNGAIGGAVVGGVAGAFRPNGNVVGGALGGAMIGAIVGHGTGAELPEETKRRMVDICLEDKGYRVAGWE